MTEDEVSARAALRYGLGREVLLLVAAMVAGAVLFGVGMGRVVHGVGGLGIALRNAIGYVVAAAGLALQVGAGVGLLYKVLRDATA